MNFNYNTSKLNVNKATASNTMSNKNKNLYSYTLIKQLSIKQNRSIQETRKAYQYLIKTIITYLIKDNIIRITGFGKFIKSKRNQKQTTHPLTKKRYTIPKRQTVQCKFSKLVN